MFYPACITLRAKLDRIRGTRHRVFSMVEEGLIDVPHDNELMKVELVVYYHLTRKEVL